MRYKRYKKSSSSTSRSKRKHHYDITKGKTYNDQNNTKKQRTPMEEWNKHNKRLRRLQRDYKLQTLCPLLKHFKLIGECILSDITLLVSFLTGCMTMEERPGIQRPDSQKPASKRIKTMSNERGFFHYTSYQIQRKEKAIMDL